MLVAASVSFWPLHPETGRVDRTVDLSWPTPTLVFEPQPTDGPVTVMVTYTVAAAKRADFEVAMKALGSSRRRTGATRWRLYRSGEDAETMLESFVVPSWAEYRRQQTQRFTGRDREIRQAVIDLSEGEPREVHYFPPDVHPARTEVAGVGLTTGGVGAGRWSRYAPAALLDQHSIPACGATRQRTV
ncbi:MAG: MFS transporter [Galbitalea sp.]